MALLLMLLISGCASAWELLPTPSFSSSASSAGADGREKAKQRAIGIARFPEA